MVDLKRQYDLIKDEINQGMQQVLSSSSFINGPVVKEFQNDLESYLGVKHVIPCANGTDSLQIALMSLKLKPGDEVISVAAGFPTTVNPIFQNGAVPVFIDIKLPTYTISCEEVDKGIIDSKTCHQYMLFETLSDTDFKDNIPVLLSLITVWYNNFWGVETEAIIPYSQYLKSLPAYLQQAIMESNGKGTDRNGDTIGYQTGNIIWGASGTNAQHAFFQLMHQGTKIIPSDFIAFKKSLYGDSGQHKILNSNFLAQTNALMMGKIYKGTDIHKNVDGNKPSNSIVINKLNPLNLGALISIYENKIFTIGSILNIFSYDQWGVELGKSIAKDISKGKQDNLDQSTVKISEILKK